MGSRPGRAAHAGCLRGRARQVGQRGQALVFISVTTVVVLLAALAMFSMGQFATTRMKLQNTADAVTYSAALTQARDLNFSAYMNRAVIANQVAVAQFVGLTGWARNVHDVYSGSYAAISDALANMSTLSALWTVPSNIAKPVASALRSTFNAIGPVTVKVLDVLIDLLTGAAQAYHYGMAITIPQTVADVLEANDPNASVSTLGFLAAAAGVVQHITFASRYKPTDSSTTSDNDRMANVTQASTDNFYKNRTLPITFWPLPMLIDPVRLFVPGVGPLLMFRFHSGGSALQKSTTAGKNAGAFVSADATGLFVIFCVTISIFGIPIPIPFPLPPLPSGSGGAAAGNYTNSLLTNPVSGFYDHRNAANDGGDSLAAVQFGGAYFNPMTYTYWQLAANVDQSPQGGSNMDSRGGLKTYMELKANKGATAAIQAKNDVAATDNHQNDKAPAFVIEIERASNTVATANWSPSLGTYRIGTGAGSQLDLEDKSGGSLKALSKAQAYWSRPTSLFPRDDGKTEWGSLYNPYWQAQLVSNSLLEQAGSMLVTALF